MWNGTRAAKGAVGHRLVVHGDYARSRLRLLLHQVLEQVRPWVRSK